jgi:LPPG:FO 2-phospho-L-lactate transferase
MTARIVILTGGVGGAKLVLGLAEAGHAQQVFAIVNTGDDFRHLGLHVAPDIDTVVYTLAGLADPVRGWGRADESWAFMSALATLAGPDWFSLGDRDLATHVLRTWRLDRGETLSEITRDFTARLGVTSAILPMSDQPIATRLATTEGWMDFQDYFVRRRAEPVVTQVEFHGASSAAPAPAVLAAVDEADVILIAPSNPLLSIDPILSVPDIRKALDIARAPVVAVSPLIGGQAVKGPTAKLMQELGLERSNAGIVRHYGDLLDGLVIDSSDVPGPVGLAVAHVATRMRTRDDRIRVARAALGLAAEIGR